MVRSVVGGRDFNFDKRDVEKRMRPEVPETVREHLVEIDGRSFPPKQVVAALTGWERGSFTTLEAQRVLARIGLVCRRKGIHAELDEGELAAQRLDRVETALNVANLAITSLAERLDRLEAQRS